MLEWLFSRQVRRAIALLPTILERIIAMSAELDRLTTEVSEQRTVIDSAITLLGQLADLIPHHAGRTRGNERAGGQPRSTAG